MLLEDILPKQLSNHLEDKASEVLRTNNIKYPYEIDLELIINKYKNIRVFYSNQDSKVIMKRNMAIIVINNSIEYKKQRQELAEEFSHVLLHCGNQIDYEYKLVLDKQESQAKRMSAYLLCPLSMLKTLSIPIETYYTTNELSDIFNVTNEFMKYRLKLIWGQDLDIITYHKDEFYGHRTIE